MRRFAVLALAFVALTTASTAQTIVIEKPRAQPLGPRAEAIRVTVGVNFTIPGRVDSSDESVKAQENARRIVYEIASRECALLKYVVAGECQLDSVNVTVNRHGNQPGVENVAVNGNLGFRISSK